MKGIITGYEPIDYISKKTGEPVKGGTIYINCKSADAFGYVGKSEFISESSPVFTRAIRPHLDKFLDEGSEIFGAAIDIDYDVTQRGGQTFTKVTDIVITLPERKKGA